MRVQIFSGAQSGESISVECTAGDKVFEITGNARIAIQASVDRYTWVEISRHVVTTSDIIRRLDQYPWWRLSILSLFSGTVDAWCNDTIPQRQRGAGEGPNIYASDVVASATVVDQSATIQAHVDRIRDSGGVGKIILPPSSSAAPIWIGTAIDIDDLLYLEIAGQGDPGLSGGYGTVLRQIVTTEDSERQIFIASDAFGNGVYYFHNFAMWGCGEAYPTLGEDWNRHTQIYGAEKITFERVGSYYSRHMGISVAYCGAVEVVYCRVERCHRDAISVVECARRTIAHNFVKNCADDAIACHSNYVGANPPTQSNIITDNHIADSFGIVVIGAVKTVISDNVIDRPKGYGCKFIAVGAEGENDVCDLTISDNIITNVIESSKWGAGSQNAGILLNLPTDDFVQPVTGGTTPRFMLPELISPISNLEDSANAGGQRIKIHGNTIAQTLPRVEQYADWGFGKTFYHNGFIEDFPMVTGFRMAGDGVSLSGAIIDVDISGNTFEGLRYATIFSTTFTYIGKCVVHANHARRLSGGLVFANHASTVKHGKLDIDNNWVDGDPFFESSNRDYVNGNNGTCTISVADPAVITFTTHGLFANTAVRFTTTGALPTGITASATEGTRSYYVKEVLTADTFTISTYAGGPEVVTTGTQSGTHTCFASIPDGTWTTNDSQPYLCDLQDWEVTNITKNRLRNLNAVLLSDADTVVGWNNDNVVYMQPNAAATLASTAHADNAGIRSPGAALTGGRLVYEDSTPTSSTYGQCAAGRGSTGFSSSIPTAGFYLQGEVEWNSAYTVATQTLEAGLVDPTPQYALLGWKRMTTGTGHVLNTDWREIRALTGQ